MTIDDVLPAWDWRSAHATRVAASPERAADAVRAFSGRDLPVTGVLMRIRALGRRTFDERPTLETMSRIGLTKLADGPQGIVVGGVLSPWLRGGRYWRLIGPFSSITRREMLAAIRRRAEA